MSETKIAVLPNDKAGRSGGGPLNCDLYAADVIVLVPLGELLYFVLFAFILVHDHPRHILSPFFSTTGFSLSHVYTLLPSLCIHNSCFSPQL